MSADEERGAASGDRSALAHQGVVLILAGAPLEIPGYWNLQLDVRDPPGRMTRDGRVLQRRTLEERAREAFEAERALLTEGNYRISLSGPPATVDFLEIMRAKLLVSEGQEAIEIVIAEDWEVVDAEPQPGREPRILENRVDYRRLGRADAPLPEGMVVFDLSDDGGRDDEGAQVPVQIPNARVIGWPGLRNRGQLVHEAYADAAARSLIARAAALGAHRSDSWGIYVGRSAQVAAAVLRASRGFYGGAMIPILVREQWRHDVPGTAPSWRPLGLRLLEQTKVA